MEQAIGLIDSGVGGLTVAKEIMRQLPNEEIYYVGDTARCPYGPRPVHETKKFTWEMTNFLMDRGIKMLVIACNTATAAALEEIKRSLPIPVLGVIYPGARAALKATQNIKIGVLGTIGTIQSNAYPKALRSINGKAEVISLACPKFVPLVESGQYKSPIAKKVVAETLLPLKGTGIDTLILGCTHYPLLEEIIQNTAGPRVKVISSGDETAREVSAILDYKHLLRQSDSKPEHRFYTTGSSSIFGEIARDWLAASDLRIETVSLDGQARPMGTEE